MAQEQAPSVIGNEPSIFPSAPYSLPSDKGDKIRSYHLLMHLAQRHDVFLGAFVDDSHDWQYADALTRSCVQIQLVGLNPTWGRLRSLLALGSEEPLSVRYYKSMQMQRWVDRTLALNPINKVIVLSSTMAHYVSGNRAELLRSLAPVSGSSGADRHRRSRHWSRVRVWSRSECILSR